MYKVRKINFGWYKRRHGILLENLPPLKQKLLLENNHMKWLDSDVDAFEIIFKVEDMNEHEKNPNRILWNPFRETFTNIKELEKDSDLVDWNCGICKIEIKSRMDSKKVESRLSMIRARVGTRGRGDHEGARGGAMREGGHEKMPSLRCPTLYNTTDL